MKWYLIALKKFADFNGRATRKEYWMFALFNSLILYLIMFLAIFVGSYMASVIASLLYIVATFLPSLAVTVRRAHDANHRGWWMLVPFYSLYLIFANGTQGENRFGPDPKQPV